MFFSSSQRIKTTFPVYILQKGRAGMLYNYAGETEALSLETKNRMSLKNREDAENEQDSIS